MKPLFTTLDAHVTHPLQVSLPPVIERFIRQATQNYGKAKLVLKRNKFWVESSHPDVLNKLLADPVIRGARADVSDDEGDGGSGKGGKKGGVGGFGRGVVRSKALKEHAAAALVDTVQQLAQEAAQDGEVKDAKPSMDGAMSAGAKAEAKQPGASYGGGYGPDGMSESESDHEDYHGTSKRGRFAAAAGPGPGSAAAQAAAGAGPKGRGVGPIQGGTDVGEGPSGVLDMEVEEDPTKEVLAFEIKASEVGRGLPGKGASWHVVIRCCCFATDVMCTLCCCDASTESCTVQMLCRCLAQLMHTMTS